MLASVASMIDQFNIPNIRIMQELGYEVHVACNFKEGNTCDAARIRKLMRMLRDMDVVCFQWDCPRNIYAVCRCMKAYRQLLKLTARVQYDWLHCHSPAGGVLARLAAHQRKIRAVYTAHGFHFYQGAPVQNWLLYSMVEALLAHWTDTLVTVNQEDYRFAVKNLKAKKIVRIPGVGIDSRIFRTQQWDGLTKTEQKTGQKTEQKKAFCRKYQIPESASVLLSVGELNRGKNHRMVIEALSGLKRQDVFYLICGQGPLLGRLKQYASSRGVGERIRMPGYQDCMPWIYQNADIFVFPSMREGMPVALMEAMAAGLPCVVSDIRGNRELIHDAPGQTAGGMLLFQKPGGMRFRLDQPE